MGTVHIAELIKQAEHIIAITGAGISTNAGILDFRSPGGLYSVAVQRYGLPYPEAIFDISYFFENPEPFFRLSAEMLLKDIQPTPCHRFLAQLEQTGKTVDIVTQNIDMLHEKAGSENVVECHGSYRSGRCLSCMENYTYNQFSGSLLSGKVPRCSCGGIIKPGVVFFGEGLPEDFTRLYNSPPKADLLLVMGTSLTVQPVSSFAVNLASETESILVNRDPTAYDDLFSCIYRGDLDKFAREIETLPN